VSANQIIVDSYQLLERLARHRWLMHFVHVPLIVSCGVLAFLLRFDLTIPGRYREHLGTALAVWVIVKLVVFFSFRLDREWWRYISVQQLFRLAIANCVASAVSAVVLLYAVPAGFPRSIYFIDAFFCFAVMAGARLAVRLAFDFSDFRSTGDREKRALIYGAGEAGVALLRELKQNPGHDYHVLGFIDDDRRKDGIKVLNVEVLGDGASLVRVARERAIDHVLIAVPSATGESMTSILEHCQAAGVAYKTVPGLGEIIHGSAPMGRIRDVAVEDLLGRPPNQLEGDKIAGKLRGRVVMVTGAGGSIGSELCLQIARFAPAAIVGFDIAETPLFETENEMRRTFPDVRFHPEIGSIQQVERLNEVFAAHSPSVVYHAAAYKHVPMMESQVFQAVENNIIGTANVAAAAAEHHVEDFVMISTDKAIRPTSVMGATKRMAELLVRSRNKGGTKFVSVRFGNVLGSNGSVVPIFKRQIREGGPVTVTHPDMRRYFMTIPEACQLVLQASTMGNGGEIFVLDMGEPVKIADLANKLIMLSGLRPGEDIAVEFTGVRAGEKLCEELSSSGEDTLATYHEKVRIFAGSSLAPDQLWHCLALLEGACETRDVGGLILTLKEFVPEYNPSADVLRRGFLRQPRRPSLAVATGD
jgi:FlaA1/EpsC-like NDP-sugar epimerase